MVPVTVDFTKEIGTIKPVNGVGQPPFRGMDFSMIDYLKEAHIPYSRLHDVGGAFGRNMFVDIPNLFRDFDADPTKPENYDFAFTDLLITALVERGAEPIFRLGVTIENYRTIRAYRIDPPADYKKWAMICEHIIRHYTQGWANGFTYPITYWEIWNEPDNFEKPEENQMWNGTAEQYYRLYEVASKHLKEKFPHLKIGGYASCGFYALTDSGADTANGKCSPRFTYFIDFFDGFLEYIKANDCPLDFFSWHSYSGIRENVIWAAYARKRLDESGYQNTEHTLNEWNCRPELKGTLKHAALSGGMLCALQNTSLDSAMFYDARCNMGIYSGFFDCMTYQPLPTYYSFVAFGELFRRGTQVLLSELPEGVYGCAAKDEDGCLMLVNTNDTAVEIHLNAVGFSAVKTCKVIREGEIWQETGFAGCLDANSVWLLYLES